MEFESLLIRHGAPTLAGLKTAALFWYSCQSLALAALQVEEWNQVFGQKGIRMRILKTCKNRVLLYVYREKKLLADLESKEVREILRAAGYPEGDLSAVFVHLGKRLSIYQEFPHEIGLFLGYPLEDVQGFIENKGKNFQCCGCWKVYCNECEKKKLFEQYKRCGQIYMKLFLRGRTVWQLTVAA